MDFESHGATGELAAAEIRGGHHDIYTIFGNTHCGGYGACKLSIKVAQLQHLKRMIALYKSMGCQ